MDCDSEWVDTDYEEEEEEEEAEEEQEQEKQQPQEGKEEPKMEIAKLEQPVNKESEINGETITTTLQQLLQQPLQRVKRSMLLKRN